MDAEMAEILKMNSKQIREQANQIKLNAQAQQEVVYLMMQRASMLESWAYAKETESTKELE